ncbi:MAG: Glyoxalase/bleomycin resistance protein/dioxygenase [Ilumatobacteraceae bacterium]|nr:Glyoxalase/bleomycin resistance protein/dioxygenase [Ilumatobacteraceae bacterium]
MTLGTLTWAKGLRRIAPVRNLDVAVAHYHRLGLRRAAVRGPRVSLRHPRRCEIHLGLLPQGVAGTEAAHAHPWFADADGLARTARTTGVDVGPPEDTAWEQRESVLIDLDGNLIRFGSVSSAALPTSRGIRDPAFSDAATARAEARFWDTLVQVRSFLDCRLTDSWRQRTLFRWPCSGDGPACGWRPRRASKKGQAVTETTEWIEYDVDELRELVRRMVANWNVLQALTSSGDIDPFASNSS